MKHFPHYNQIGAMDCGPVCLQIIAKFYGRNLDIENLREKCRISKLGVSLYGIAEAAESIGFETMSVKLSIDELMQFNSLPCILHWNQNHFVVLYKINAKKAYISDPAKGKVVLPIQEFISAWNQNNQKGVALMLDPANNFYDIQGTGDKSSRIELSLISSHLKHNKWHFFQMFLGLLFSSAALLISPFFLQILVDNGIHQKDLSIVYLILAGQLIFFIGSSLEEILRNHILLNVGSKISMSLMSAFLKKLFQLPVKFFDTHKMGDLLQRINDHKKIEQMITLKSLSVVFSALNILVLSGILFYFNLSVFFLFFSGSLLSVFWVLLFMKKRAFLEHKFFELYSKQQGKLIDFLEGMEDVKISNSSRQKRWEWQELQNSIFGIKVNALSIEQWQQNGFEVIMRITGIFLTIATAKLVIEGSMTLGTMFAINMLIGQLLSPISSIVDFIPAWQDARLAFDRIKDIHLKDSEYKYEEPGVPFKSGSIEFRNVWFSYSGDNSYVLKDISFNIEKGKTTAIVGSSGSGKTSMVKLMLQFYQPTKGEISIGNKNLNSVSADTWRELCGVVLQNGRVFSDTIVNNIALGQVVDMEQIVMTSAMANLDDFVNSDLPMGYFTQIGDEGLQLSEGQKQRLLLARAMYKNPDFLFLDEATSSLDASNERNILTSLREFSKGKTVVIVAHRLSTVRNADKILVIDKGKLVETGRHDELIALKGFYYDLIKDQLTLNQI